MYWPDWKDLEVYLHKYEVLLQSLVPYCRSDATVITRITFNMMLTIPCMVIDIIYELGTATSGTARSSSHQLKVLYFLLKRDLANSPVISSRPSPLPVVIADHAIIPRNPNVCISMHNTYIYIKYLNICTFRLPTNADFVIQFGHIELGFFPTEHMVFCLLNYRRYAVELPAVAVCIHNLRNKWSSVTTKVQSTLEAKKPINQIFRTSAGDQRAVPQYITHP